MRVGGKVEATSFPEQHRVPIRISVAGADLPRGTGITLFGIANESQP